jgi:peptidoglycan/xylan/chitin deacetylase (PgdA/CDA1 family)
MFHDLDRHTADYTFRYLTQHYNVVGLNTYLEAIRTKNDHLLPRKCMIITFDDGYVGNYHILPEIKKFDLPITIFLCSEMIDTSRHFWFSLYPRKKVEYLKKKTNKEKLEIMKKDGKSLKDRYPEAQTINHDQINAMRSHVNFQAHTQFHPILPKCTNKEAEREIVESKRKLETDFKIPVNAFAYPNGDYSSRDIEICKNAGYECAITVDYGFNTVSSDPYRLKRIPVDMTYSLSELVVKASGFSEFLSVVFRIKPRTKFSTIYIQ